MSNIDYYISHLNLLQEEIIKYIIEFYFQLTGQYLNPNKQEELILIENFILEKSKFTTDINLHNLQSHQLNFSGDNFEKYVDILLSLSAISGVKYDLFVKNHLYLVS